MPPITHEQAGELNEHLRPMLAYLGRVRNRLQAVGYLPDDPLYRRVNDAYNGMHALTVEVHYLSCKGGVG